MKAVRIARASIGMYPYDYRVAVAREMLEVFERSARERVAVEVVGLAAGAGREWIGKLTTDPWIRGRSLPDLRKMRLAVISKEEGFSRCSSDIWQ